MDRILDERKIILSNSETDVQAILYKLLLHMREIKVLKMHMERHNKRKKKQEEN